MKIRHLCMIGNNGCMGQKFPVRSFHPNTDLYNKLVHSFIGAFELISAKIPPVEFIRENVSMIGMLAFYIGLFFLLDYFF